jgi:hypothetical protein
MVLNKSLLVGIDIPVCFVLAAMNEAEDGAPRALVDFDLGLGGL